MTDWKEKTLGYLETIDSMATRRFGQGALADEASLAVIDGLKADNWRRIRAYNGKAKFVTFVRTLTARLLEDFARKRFGRVRPPLWVKTLGGIWVKLFEALCLERLPVTEAVEVVLQRHAVAKRSEIENATYELLERISDCGMHHGLEVVYEEKNSSDEGDGKPPLHSVVEEQQKKELFEAIFQITTGEKEFEVSGGLLKKMNELKINLAPGEKLLLKLCYQDGLTVAKAAEMLGMSRFQAHGKKRRLMARLKEEFERTGLAEELRPLLEI